MENAAEALRMAGGFLIFVLALTISINAFTQARQGIDDVVLYSDREYLSLYLEQNDSTKRVVGAESIVPTIYRAYKENVKINFAFLDNKIEDECLYSKENLTTGEKEYITYIDLESENISDETKKDYIIKRILFGNEFESGNDNNGFDIEYSKDLEKQLKIKFNPEGLYYRLMNYVNNNTQFEEELGVYYPDEAQGTNDKSTINKTEKKVITYNIK